MTTSNHIFAGAAIAMAVKQPILALPLAFASHFAMDALPHYGYEGGGFGDAVKHKMTFVMESVNIIGIPLLAYLTWYQTWWVWIAAIVAISPDFVWIRAYFAYERKGLEMPDGPLTQFHRAIQWGERKWGILIEVPILVGLTLIVSKLAV